MPAEYDAAAALERIENEIIDSMMRNLRNHLKMEKEEGFDWKQWQVQELEYLEDFRKKNAKKYGPQFASINRRIKYAISHARAGGQKDEEKRILQMLRDHPELKKSIRKTGDARTEGGDFFKINQNKFDALVKATTNDMTKAEHAVLRRANDQYRKIIFDAEAYANTGAGTIEKAVDMATHDFLLRGIDSIVYKNGARHTISDYADMAIRTAERRATLMGAGEKRKEWGEELVIVNRRGTMKGGNFGHACPLCIPWLGQILVDDVYSGGKPDGRHQLVSTAMQEGFLHPRCKDTFTTYFPGVTSAPDPVTKSELKAGAEADREEARRQYAERQAEKYGRLAKYSLDPENKRRYEAREDAWERKSDELTDRRKQRLEVRRKILSAPDFSQMDGAQLKKYAQDQLKTSFVGMEGANTDFVREAVKVISQFEEKMGGQTIDGLKVQFGGLPNGVYAKYDDKTKTLLLKKTGNLEQFEERLRAENARYRRRWNTDKDYHATETFSGTIWHEIGHAVDIESGQALSRGLSASAALDEASVKVSAYAGTTQGIRVTKRSEAWAENFAAYMDGGRNMDRVPPEIAEMINDRVKYLETKESRSIIGEILNGEDEEPPIDWPERGDRMGKERNRIIREYGKRKGIDIGGLADTDLSIESAYEVIDDAAKYLNMYPELKEGRTSISFTARYMLDSRSFAGTTNLLVSINADAYRDLEKLEDEYQKLVKKHWFPQGTDHHALIAHEIGHVIHHRYPEIDPIEIARRISGKNSRIGLMEYISEHLSDYAAYYKNGQEIISECYACVLTGTDNEFALKFVQECDKIIKEKRREVL